MPAILAGITSKQNEEKRKPSSNQGTVHQDPHMNEARKFGWVDTNVPRDYNRPANYDNSAWTSWFFTFSRGLMTRLLVSMFFGKQKFCGEC